MKREDISKIFEGATDEQINSILNINSADIGKAKADYENLKQELGTAKQSLADITGELQTLKDSNADAEDWKKKYDELKATQDKAEAERQKAKEDAELTDAITAVFGDRKFTSDYVRNGIIADMKSEIAKPENKGKGYSEIFTALTKDKDGIFQNPNPPADMSGMSNDTDTNITKEDFRKMGYKARAKLFNENKELYDELSKE